MLRRSALNISEATNSALTGPPSHHDLGNLLADRQLRFRSVNAHACQALDQRWFLVLHVSHPRTPRTHLVPHDLVKDRHELGLPPPLWRLDSVVQKVRSVVVGKDEVLEMLECSQG